MTKYRDVGRSQRTPAKHALMSSIYGREVGVVNRSPFHRSIERLVWVDLTAGDGVPADGLPWRSNCSPGITAFHAAHSVKPVDLTLYEIKTATFERLLGTLAEQLPRIGYEQVSETEWKFGDRVALRAIMSSGEHATVDHIRSTDALLVSNDPNAITDWAMRPTFAAEVAERTWCARSISTMGCNVGGLLRSDIAVRSQWFELIRQQVAAVPHYRDLVLAAIEGDSSKWAYLLCEPIKWRTTVEQTVATAFRRYGYSMELAWCRQEPAEFADITSRLFLTRKERDAS